MHEYKNLFLPPVRVYHPLTSGEIAHTWSERRGPLYAEHKGEGKLKEIIIRGN